MRIPNKLLTAASAAILASIAIVMATGAPETKASPPKKAKETVSIDGDKWKWSSAGDTSSYSITGNVVIKHGDTVITGDKADYDEKGKTAVVVGHLKIVDGQNVITGEKATTYLNDRKNVVEGNVKLVGSPKPDAGTKNPDSVAAKLRDPVNIVCDKLEYLYKKKIATAEGGLKITSKGRTLVGTRAVYDVGLQFVTLSGGVRVTDEKGQAFSSPGEIKVSLKEGGEWIESGTASATLNFDLDEELGQDKPTEQKAGQDKPAEKKAGQDKPAEKKPGQDKPAETKQ